MQKEVEAPPRMFMTVGVVHSKGGWHIAPHTHKHEGRRFLDAALSLASQLLHLDLVTTVRACRGVASMPVLKLYVCGEVIAWCRGSGAQDIAHYSPQGADVNKKLLAQQLALEFDDVGKKAVNWQEVCFIQILCVQSTQCKNIVSIAPHIPFLAGAGAPSRRRKANGPVDEDAAPQPLGSRLDIDVRPPPKQQDFPKIQSKVANERPTEGIVTICRPNKNSRFTQQSIAKVESRTVATSKFCNRGSTDHGGRCHKNTQAVLDCAQKSQPTGGGTAEVMQAMLMIGKRGVSRRNLRTMVKNLVARSPHLNKNAASILVFDSPELAKEERSPDRDGADRGLWHNWKQELVESRSIIWRDEILNAQPDEGFPFDPHDVYIYIYIYILIAPTGKLPRDMIKKKIQENWQDVSNAKVKESAGLYDLGCFKRWPRHKSNNIIDARWDITWNTI